MFTIKHFIHNIKRLFAMPNSLDVLKAKADLISKTVDEAISANNETIAAQTAQIADLMNQIAEIKQKIELLTEEKISSDDIDGVFGPIIEKLKTMIPSTIN